MLVGTAPGWAETQRNFGHCGAHSHPGIAGPGAGLDMCQLPQQRSGAADYSSPAQLACSAFHLHFPQAESHEGPGLRSCPWMVLPGLLPPQGLVQLEGSQKGYLLLADHRPGPLYKLCWAFQVVDKVQGQGRGH